MISPYILLVSQPRSGNTFARYMMEYMTGIPSLGYPKGYAGDNGLEMEMPLIHKDANKKNQSDYVTDSYVVPSAIFKLHGFTKDLTELNKVNIGGRLYALIWLVRNPLELCARENAIPSDIEKDFLNLDMEKNTLFPGIERLYDYYERFEGAKKTIYYEDMINDAPYFMKEIAEFLEIKDYESKISNFMEHYDHHVQTCLNIYQKEQPGESKTKGKKEIKHSSIYTKKEKINLWKKYIQTYPYLRNIFNRYVRETLNE